MQMVRAELRTICTAGIEYVGKGGYSLNSKIIPAKLSLLIAKYTPPFNKSVKSDYN